MRRDHIPGSVPIAWSLSLSTMASIGLTVVYARGGQPQLEGVLLFVSLGGLAVALIVWAHRFLPLGPYEQEREPMQPPAREERAFLQTLERGGAVIGRRRFLTRLLGVTAAALGAAAVFPIRSFGPRPGRAYLRTAWRRGARVVTRDGNPVAPGDLEPGGTLVVFPEDAPAADSQVVLVRLTPGELQTPTRLDWAPDDIVGYSRLCTHAGCPVGLYEQESNQLFCPCHQSVFDVTRAARPVSGPATRPLPQLPMEIGDDGFLVARSDFEDVVGPGFWEAPS
jgi:quinol---cytochrome c reductase iron-sulfur subunit